MLYVNNFFDPIQQLSQLYNTFLSAAAALDKIIDVLDEEPEVVDAARRRAARAHRGPRPLRRRPLRLRPRRRAEEVLHGIDLDVPAGTTVALVGHTGAGKSTIAKLLARFYEPTSGRITIDGVDLNDVDAGVAAPPARDRPAGGLPLRRHGRREHRLRQARRAAARRSSRAAQTVGAHEFILRLEDGYETQLGERGSRLSLGQRQLVAFARALLADPRILILDEATSSVDIGTERTIEQALRTLLADRTAFVIAHRLSTIRDADLIVVLEHGQVVEQGSHDELLARQGRYTSLYGDWAADASASLSSTRVIAIRCSDRRVVLEEEVLPRRRARVVERRRRRTAGRAADLRRGRASSAARPVRLRLHVPRDDVLQRQREELEDDVDEERERNRRGLAHAAAPPGRRGEDVREREGEERVPADRLPDVVVREMAELVREHERDPRAA